MNDPDMMIVAKGVSLCEAWAILYPLTDKSSGPEIHTCLHLKLMLEHR